MRFKAARHVLRDTQNQILLSLLISTNYLFTNSYELIRLESIYFIGSITAACLIPLYIFKKLKCDWIWNATLLFLAADLFFGVFESLRSIGYRFPGPDRITANAFVLGVMAIWIGVYKFTRSGLDRIICFGLAAAFLTCLISNLVSPDKLFRLEQGVASETNTSLPNLYYIVLDEHIGLGSIPGSIPDSKRIKNNLRDMYVNAGFAVYENAYSNYNATSDSIPSLLNFKIDQDWRADLDGNRLMKNDLFAKLINDGFKLNIYQNTHINLCNTPGIEMNQCMTYKASSTGFTQPAPMRVGERYWLLLSNYIGTSKSVMLRKVFREIAGDRPLHLATLTGALATDAILNQVLMDVADNPRGTAFFIHLLLPHGSYIYDSGCQVKPSNQWLNPLELPFSEGVVNTPQTRIDRYTHYLAQVECAHSKLNTFFEILERDFDMNNSSVIIASDHGSRIYEHMINAKYKDRLTPTDLRDAFSAFLAIKNGGYSNQWPVNTGAVIQEPQPIISMVGRFFNLMSEEEQQKEGYKRLYLSKGQERGFESLNWPI